MLCRDPAKNIHKIKSGNTPIMVPKIYLRNFISDSAAVTLITVYPMGNILKIAIEVRPSSLIILFNFFIFFLESKYCLALAPRDLTIKKVTTALKKQPTREIIRPFTIPKKRAVAVDKTVTGNMVIPAMINASRSNGYKKADLCIFNNRLLKFWGSIKWEKGGTCHKKAKIMINRAISPTEYSPFLIGYYL